MAPSLLETSIEAQIGKVSGGSQVAVGKHILQIGSLEGGLVYFGSEGQVVPRPRPQPVLLRPRVFTGLLDRVSETDSAVQALQSGESVECSGDPGIGKTSLLRHLSYHPRAEAFPSGVVYFQVNRQSPADLLKALFDAFYEYDSPLKPTETQIRHYLQDVYALILLDDVEAAREQTEYLMNVVPKCTFITASTERSLFGEAREVVLKGLPDGEALILFEREFGRALSGEERRAAQALCESLGCYPLRVLRAAMQAREEGLPEFAGPAFRSPVMPPAQVPGPDVVRPRSEDEGKVLAVLSLFHGAPVRAEHLAEVAEVQSAPRVLEGLVERGLVQSHEGRYSIAGDIGGTLRRERETTPWLERALAHFADWAERNRREPKLIAAEAQPILLILERGVAAERWSEVRRLGHAAEEALALSGKWDAWAAALQCVLRAARAQEYLAEEAWALHQLGTRALCLEERPAALAFLNAALAMRRSLNDVGGAAATSHNLNLLLSPPPDQSHTKPDPSPLPLLLKLIVPALLLMAGGATIAYRFRPQKLTVKPVRIMTFSAKPETVPASAQAQLCYEVLDASSARIEPGVGERKPTATECLTVTPQRTTVYTLTATGPDGSTVSRQVTVNVEATPVTAPPTAEILGFAVQRRNGPGGANDVQFQLCYGVRNADRVEIDNGFGMVAAGGQQCVLVKPSQTTTYTLTATGSDGQPVQRQVTVDATKPPPPPAQILSFDASPARIVAGETAQLCYRLSGASSAHIDPGSRDVSAGPDIQCVNVEPREPTAYTLTALNPEGKPVSRRTTVAVTPPAPKVVVFTADPNSVETEGRVNLCYETTDATRVEIDNGVGPVAPADRGCAETLVRLASKTFKLTATGSSGRSASSSVTVTVTLPPPTISLRAHPESIQKGEKAQLCYSIAHARSYEIDHGVGAGRGLSSTSAGESCTSVQPTATTTYTARAIGLNGQTVSAQATVEVVSEPRPDNNNSDSGQRQQPSARITRLEIKRRMLGTMQLCYAVENARNARVEPDFGDVKLPGDCMNIRATEPGTYTLTATGIEGQTVSRSVEYTPPLPPRPLPISIFSFSPASQTIARGNQARICYSTLGEGTAQISPQVGEVQPSGWPLKKCVTVAPTETTVYRLTVIGPEGQKNSKQVTVNVRQPVIQ